MQATAVSCRPWSGGVTIVLEVLPRVTVTTTPSSTVLPLPAARTVSSSTTTGSVDSASFGAARRVTPADAKRSGRKAREKQVLGKHDTS